MSLSPVGRNSERGRLESRDVMVRNVRMNLAESLLHGLTAYGASEIFGIPGDFALPLFKVVEESRILPLYTLSHEPAVGFASDADTSRRHGRPCWSWASRSGASGSSSRSPHSRARWAFGLATSFMGRGLLAGEDVPLQGTYMGVAGDPDLARLVESSDALIMLGVILSDTNFGVSRKKIDLRRAILAVDGQVSLGYHVYPDLPLRALVEGLNRKVEPTRRASAPMAPMTYPRGLEPDGQAITPTDIARAVNDLFDRVGLMPIASDTGDCLSRRSTSTTPRLSDRATTRRWASACRRGSACRPQADGGR